jgi:hypothetical protein
MRLRLHLPLPLHVVAGLILLGALLVACLEQPKRASAPTGALDQAEAIRFLVQHECANHVLTPLQENCLAPRPARPGTLTYRRFDWSGVQAQDALLLGPDRVVQTFDFGDAPRAFARFDQGRGDGGDLISITAAGAFITLTEDGGAGRQHWQEPGCPPSRGWLLFAYPLTPSAPGSRGGSLGRSSAEGACTTSFSPVTTVWARTTFTFPWREGDGPMHMTARPAIVSEHYAGPAERPHHMERFVFVEHLGKIAWERWENVLSSRRDQAELMQSIFAMNADGRCPIEARPPEGSWVRADCRVWTKVAPGPAQPMGWP